MISIREEFAGLIFGAPTRFQNLTIFPVFRQNTVRPEPGYVLLEQAIHSGFARVSEVCEGGIVPQLRFENSGPLPVLLLDGEELVGAKQNRVLNLSILAPANAGINIPVSCVEAGRWQHQSTHFAPADAVQYSTGRAARAKQVSKSMQESGSRQSDQGRVWADIAEKSIRMQADSDTGAMRAIYEKHRDTVEHYARAFSLHTNQCGMLFTIGHRSWGIDLLDHPSAMGLVFARLLRGYALDALDSNAAAGPKFRTTDWTHFIEGVAAAPVFAALAVGLGKDVRIVGPAACGGALWAEDRYIHLSAFSSAADQAEGGPYIGIARPSRRRG